MRVKLDENLGRSISRLFTTAGHDVSTVAAQEMQGAADDEVFRVCVAEQRTIVTLDLDFANPFQFDPRPTAGIAVLRLPTNHGPSPYGAASAQHATAADGSWNSSAWDAVEEGVRLR